ncbi:MAG: CHAD domain-containing protein, partial [Chloroflexi bacterium]
AAAKEVIRSVLAQSVAHLLRHDPIVRTGGDPEAVHQARVAIRTLRSNLRTFGPLLDPEWTEPIRTELGWLGLALGAVRDREVLLDRLRARATSLPHGDQRAAASLLSVMDKEIEELRHKLIVDLDSARYVDLIERLVAAALAPRYAAEAVQAVAGPVATSFARAAAKLQTVLGEHQDSVTAQAWLRSARATGRRAFAAGELIAMEHIAANDARAKWLKVWKALDRKRLRSWIGT